VRGSVDGHKATSIGNKLHPIYEQYFLAYEQRHPQVRWSGIFSPHP